MTNPFLAVTKLVSTVSDASAHLFVPMFKSALTIVVVPERAGSLYPIAENSDGIRANRQARFVYGRVRWTPPRMIIEWQAKQGTNKENFAIYRGRTMVWREAQLLDLSIFATTNSQSNMATYRAVDITVRPPGPYYYWIINLRARDGEQRFGPYRAAIEEARDDS